MRCTSFDTLTHQGVKSSQAFEIVAKIMYSILSFPCSVKHNSRWSSADAHNCIMSLCINNSYAESGLKRLALESENNSPTGSWLRKTISKISQKTMLIQLHKALDNTISSLQELRVFENPVTVAIDKHLIPRYDKTQNHSMIKSRSKKSTNSFEGYCTMQCVSPVSVQLGCYPVNSGKQNAKFVRKLLHDGIKNNIKIGLVLLDREFFSVGVIHQLKQKQLKFLMPAVKTPGIKKAILQYVNGNREAISEYRIHSSSGHVESFTLVIMPSLNPRASNVIDRYIVFATNVSPKEVSQNIAEIPSQYKKRWGIETGYAYVGRFRPKTTTTNQSIRLLYFYYSLILYNAWIVANILYLQESSGIYHKPIISIELLRHFFSRIIVEWFCNHTKNYHLECVK